MWWDGGNLQCDGSQCESARDRRRRRIRHRQGPSLCRILYCSGDICYPRDGGAVDPHATRQHSRRRANAASSFPTMHRRRRRRRALATERDVLRIGVGRAVDLCSDNPFNVPLVPTALCTYLCSLYRLSLVRRCRQIHDTKVFRHKRNVSPKLACRDENRRHFALSATCRRHVADISNQAHGCIT